ncbi:hypothetical protein BXZ70DRAFT_899408, partial [Cristinia sonorae]
WTSRVYAFFSPDVKAEEELKTGRRRHIFKCAGRGCGKEISRYLDTGDRSSTSALKKHVVACKSWGEAAYNSAMEMSNVVEARKALARYRDGDIKGAFEVKGKGKPTYSTRQLTPMQMRYSLRPFETVSDEEYIFMMKTGRPELYIPSPSTVSRDLRRMFVNVRVKIARMIQAYEGRVSFSSDCWTAPITSVPYMGVLAHFEQNGVPFCLPLDLVEVPFSHTGEALADEFQRVLDEFGIQEKVSTSVPQDLDMYLHTIDAWVYGGQCGQ